MSNTCSYCKGYLYSPEERKEYVCRDCAEQVKKLDESTVNWILKVIDGRVDEKLDDHRDRYAHESSHPGYY